MKAEREHYKKKLDEELGEIRFTKEAEVLGLTHPRTWRQSLSALWNKEFEISLLPLGMSMAVIIAITAVAQLRSSEESEGPQPGKQRQLIEAGGNTYWKDNYERAVASLEGDPQG
jgi:hypothetical protein